MNYLYKFDIYTKGTQSYYIIHRSKFNQDGHGVLKLYESKLQEIRADIQELLSHSAFRNLQIFSINAKGFGSKEKVLHGRGDIKRF